MSETEVKIQGQKPKISELSIASALIPVVVMFGWSVILILTSCGLADRFLARFNEWIILYDSMLCLYAFVLAIPLFLPAAPIFGVLALVKINKSSGLLSGKGLAFLGIVLSICELIFLAYIRFFPYSLLISVYFDR